MNRITTFICFILSTTVSIAQTAPSSYTFWNSEMQSIAKQGSTPRWIMFNDSVIDTIQNLFTTYESAFGLTSDDELSVFNHEITQEGNEHIRFVHYYKGLPVVGSGYTIHKRTSGNISCLGKLERLDLIIDPPSITPEIAFNSVLLEMFNDSLLDSVELNNELSSPNFEDSVVIFNTTHSFQLILRLTNTHQYIAYVDANSGNVLLYDEYGNDCQNHTMCVSFLPNGQETFQASDLYVIPPDGTGYDLDDDCRKISVNNLLPGYQWEVVHSADEPMDMNYCAKTSALLASQITYDFFIQNEYLNTHIVNDVNQYLPVFFSDVNYGNAFASSSNILIGGNSDPGLDVVAHEWTHTVTMNYVPFGLNVPSFTTTNESTALNESFSDIFGTVVEHFYFDGNPDRQPNYLLGEDFTYNGLPLGIIRNMEDPQIWYDGGLDYYVSNWWDVPGPWVDDPHALGGVQNKWFYLLAEGGTGTTPVGRCFDITGIGIDDAAKIAFHNLMFYAFNDMTFEESRIGSIEACRDLFGLNSFQEDQVIKAWDAVGVFNKQDILPLQSLDIINQDITINKDIYIYGDASLNIINSTLRFVDGAKIYLTDYSYNFSASGINAGGWHNVIEGGSLNIVGSTLTSEQNTCGLPVETTWGGIEALEQNQKPMNLNIEYSFIENAEIGLAANYKTNLDVSHTSFYDCGTGVFFKPTQAALGLLVYDYSDINVIQTINHCLFKSNVTVVNQNPNVAQNVQSANILPIELTQVGGCFDCTYSSSISVQSVESNDSYQTSKGIENPQGTIEYNHFTNLQLGIEGGFGSESVEIASCYFLNNSVGIVNVPVVNTSIFNNNYKSILIEPSFGTSTNFIEIFDNTFYNIPLANQEDLSTVELNGLGSANFRVYENEFRGFYSSLPFNNLNGVKSTAIEISNCSNSFNGIMEIANNEFNYCDKGILARNTSGLLIGELNTFADIETAVDLNINTNLEVHNNIFDNCRKSIKIIGDGIVTNNYVENIPVPAATFSLSQVGGLSDTYGLAVEGEGNRFIQSNEFKGANIFNPTYASAGSYGAIFTQTGNSINQFVNNRMEGTDIGLQIEGQNDQLGVFCNDFAANNIAHNIAGMTLVNNTGANPASGSLRFQGTNCFNHMNPAGNEWHNVDGPVQLNDIIILPPINGTTPSFFQYVAHSEVVGSNRTIPDHGYVDWDSDANPIIYCPLGTPGYSKESNSCDNYTTKSLPMRSDGLTGIDEIDDLLIVKGELESKRTQLLSQLTDPNLDTEIVRDLQIIETQLEELVMKLYSLYMSAGLILEARLLLETENYVQSKKELARLLKNESDYENSRLALIETENIVSSKPDYLYSNFDEKYLNELNNLYYKQINELLVDAREDGRSEKNLLEWELYALDLIAYSGLPVAAEASALIRLNGQTVNNVNVIEKIPLELISQLTGDSSFVYELYVVPNPAMTNTNVSIEIESTAVSASLLLIDTYQTGNILSQISLQPGTNAISLPVSNLNNGMYSLSVQVDGIIVESEHLIVIH